MIIKSFDIDTEVKTNKLNQEQENNIKKIFDELTKESHLITNCYLDSDSENYKESPIYLFSNAENKEEFDYRLIAEKLLKAECKADKTRNSTIREGFMFIKAVDDSLTIMKLEKLSVIDIETYKLKSELGKEKDYFKVCTFKGDFKDIKIIDKNKTAAKYWYKKFLGLTRKRTSEDNTAEIINFIKKDELFNQDIINKENYNEIKRSTEYYLFDNKTFDKSDLFNKLNSNKLIELKKEDELYSEKSLKLDSDFTIDDKIINKHYKKSIETSEYVTIMTKNYLESIRNNEIIFDEENKKMIIMIDEDFINQVKKELEYE